MNELDRLPRVVFHQDDVGMCHGANVAFLELSRAGVVTSGSVMVPCPWFLEVAEAAAEDTMLDLGVHLTLTAEKRHYKWGPLTKPSAAAGLTDPNGYLWPDVSSVRHNAHPEAVEVELRAQVDRAIELGIDVTHLDGHMGAVLAPELCDVYLRLGAEYRLPVLITRRLADFAPSNHLAGVTEDQHGIFVAQAEAAGIPVFDRCWETDWSGTVDPGERWPRLLSTLADGLTFLATHPNAPGDLESIEPASAHIRVAEYDLFASQAFARFLADLPVTFLGMRHLRDTLRTSPPPKQSSSNAATGS